MKHSFFQKLADHSVDQATVAISGNEQLTYKQLLARANKIANLISSQGVVAGDRAVVFLHQSADLLSVMLACFKLGAIYVPVSPGEKPGKVADILNDCSPKKILTLTQHLPNLPKVGESLLEARVVVLDQLREEIDLCSPEDPKTHIPDNAIAYITYTSGTTSRPRGVQISYRALSYWVDLLERKVMGEEPVRMLSFISPGFDAHIWEYLLAWAKGGCNIIAPNDVRVTPRALADFVISEKITHALFLPTILRVLLPELRARRKLDGSLPITDIYSTGEELTPDLISSALSLGIRIWNAYGSTEEGFGLSIQQCTNENIWKGKAPVAYPEGEDCHAILVDRKIEGEGEPVKELYVASPHLSSGYWNRPEETKQKFVQVKHGGELLRAFKTGDRFSVGPDGGLYYMERISQEAHLKISGRMVRVQEVESKLREHDSIQDACVVSCVIGGKTILHAFVLAESIDKGAVKRYLAESLPAESIPLNFQQLDALPTTTNGKLNRRFLTEQAEMFYVSRPKVGEVPKTDFPNIEELVVQAWKKILPSVNLLEEVRVDTPFQLLGGTSVEAARIAGELSDTFKVTYSTADLPKDPNQLTIKAIVCCVYQKLCAQNDNNIVVLHEEEYTSLPPIFLIHAITGDASSTYMHLSKELSRFKRTVIAIDSRAKSNKLLMSSSIKAMAQDYAKQIQHKQAKGPIMMLGWSSGSTLAYCTALELEAAGREVGFLGLLDGIAPYIYQSVGNEAYLREIALLVDKLGVKIDKSSLEKQSIGLLNKPELIHLVFRLASEQFSSGTVPAYIKISQYMMLALLKLNIVGHLTKAVPHVFSTQETMKQLQRLDPKYRETERGLGWMNQTQPIMIYPPIGNAHEEIIKSEAPALVSAVSEFFEKTPTSKGALVCRRKVFSGQEHISSAIQSLLSAIPPRDQADFLGNILAEMRPSTLSGPAPSLKLG